MRLLLLLGLAFHCYLCYGKDVQFTHKLTSGKKADQFGASITTAGQQVAVSARNDGAGTVIMPGGVKISSNSCKLNFGEHISMNEKYLVAACLWPTSVYIHQASAPYSLKAVIGIQNDLIKDVAINENHALAILSLKIKSEHYHPCRLSIYTYDGSDAWHLGHEVELKRNCFDLAMYGSYLAIGVNGESGEWKVEIYQMKRNTVTHLQPIRLQDIPWSIDIYDKNMVIATSTGPVFLYKLSASTHMWVREEHVYGKWNTFDGGVVSIHKDIAVSTFNSHWNPGDREIIGFAFKKSLDDDGNEMWTQIARLKTNGVPTIQNAPNQAVSVQDGIVYVGRSYGFDPNYVGAVFVYDLRQVLYNSKLQLS